MTSAYLLRECRSEHEARGNVIQFMREATTREDVGVADQPVSRSFATSLAPTHFPPPHPPATAWEPLLRECVHELRRGFWLLFFMMGFVGLLTLRVTMDAHPPAPVAEYIEPVQWAQVGFRGGFDAADELPRFSELSL